jgi:hypothetical protein
MAALILALAACGEDTDNEPKAPRIPAGVADHLAGLSDETAAALEAGDDCAAQEAADELEREALKAEDEIPPELRSQVRTGVQQLTAAITCEPVTVIETVPEETTTEEDDSFCPPGQEKKEDEKEEDEEKKDEDPGGGKDDQGGDVKDKDEDEKKCKDVEEDGDDSSGEGSDDGGD